MEDFQIEIPEIDVPEVEFSEEVDYDLEMEAENAEGIEDEESETGKPSRLKARKQNRQIQHDRHIEHSRQILQNQGPRKLKVKDYLRFSVFTITFFNCLFLGTVALIYSIKAMNRKYKRDFKEAKKFSCFALTANIFAIITSIITIIAVSIITALVKYNLHYEPGQCYVI